MVVSLWNVNDRATAELMARFYHHLLEAGLRPAAALRSAQIDLRKVLAGALLLGWIRAPGRVAMMSREILLWKFTKQTLPEGDLLEVDRGDLHSKGVDR